MLRNSSTVLLGCVAVLFVANANSASSQSSPVPENASLADVSFIAGHWRGDEEGVISEEVWSEPSGDSMMGMFRYVKNGKAVFYEMMLIEMSSQGPVLKLKHFNPGLIGWEEKSEVYSFTLVKFEKDLAVFERLDKKTSLTFHRTSNDSMVAILERLKDGKMTSEEFRYVRVK